MEDCIFCKIASGEMQGLRIFEGAKENIQAIFEKAKVKE